MASDGLRRATLVFMRVWGRYNCSMNLFASLGLLLVVAVGAHCILVGTLQVGDLRAFLFYQTFSTSRFKSYMN